MKTEELHAMAIEEIRRRVAADGPPEPRVLSERDEAAWNAGLLRTVSEHELHVLGRGADIVVFLDKDGGILGWRDDGRLGTPQPAWIDRDAFLKAISAELELPPGSRLGTLEPRELPPVGWTHEAVLFLAAVPRPDQVLRVWACPKDLRIIQCLYGPVNRKEAP